MSTLQNQRTLNLWLLLGDLAALLVISIIGFITHGEAIGWNLLTTFLPFLVAWALIAPWLGVYRSEIANAPLQAWRPALAAFLAAPMAAWLRGFLLNNRPILPIFVLALGGSAALGYLIWRLIWALLQQRVVKHG